MQCSISQRLKCSFLGLRGGHRHRPSNLLRIDGDGSKILHSEGHGWNLDTWYPQERQSPCRDGRSFSPYVRACFSRPFDSIRTHTLLKFQAGARVERRKILAGARSPDGHRSRSRRRGTAGMRSRADAVAARQKRRRFCQGDRKRVAPPCTHRSILLELMMMKIQRMSKNLPFPRCVSCYGIPAGLM